MATDTLNGIIIALLTTVGIAVAISAAIVLAGALFKRDAARAGRAGYAVPARHATQTDDARELVLR